MAARQLSGWQIATLILAFSAVIAIAAVALILGKDAVISIAVILVVGIALVAWFLMGVRTPRIVCWRCMWAVGRLPQPWIEREGFSMGFRRRTRRRALVAGAAVAHHRGKVNAEQQEAADAEGQQAAAQQAPPPAEPAQYAPPPADPAAEIEHLAQLHASGAITDEEFATAKANVLGT